MITIDKTFIFESISRELDLVFKQNDIDSYAFFSYNTDEPDAIITIMFKDPVSDLDESIIDEIEKSLDKYELYSQKIEDDVICGFLI